MFDWWNKTKSWFPATTNKAPEMLKYEPPQQDSVESMKVLTLEEGDTVVLSIKHKLSDAAYARIKEQWEAQWKDCPVVPKVLVLEGGATIGVIRKE